MFLRIERVHTKQIIGNRLEMTTARDRSAELWRGFMPNRKHIQHSVNDDVLSIQLFPSTPDFTKTNSDEPYTNWAGKEVSEIENIPAGMDTLTIEEGDYAVFLHKGTAADFPATATYIFGQWLPNSGYQVDNRPFFQVIKPGYKPDDPASEEEMYVPVKNIKLPA